MHTTINWGSCISLHVPATAAAGDAALPAAAGAAARGAAGPWPSHWLACAPDPGQTLCARALMNAVCCSCWMGQYRDNVTGELTAGTNFPGGMKSLGDMR